MVFSAPYLLSLFWNTHIVHLCVCAFVCVCVPATVLSIVTTFANKEIVSGTFGEDSVTLRLSSLPVFTMTMYDNLCFNVFAFFVCKRTIKNKEYLNEKV